MTLIISAAEVSAALGLSVDDAEVQRAQDIIELYASGQDLNTAGQADRFTAADLRRLRLAVQWEVAYLRNNFDSLTAQNAVSVSANGASIQFGGGPQWLSSLSHSFLRQCSWSPSAVRVQTLRPTLAEDTKVIPDEWAVIG